MRSIRSIICSLFMCLPGAMAQTPTESAALIYDTNAGKPFQFSDNGKAVVFNLFSTNADPKFLGITIVGPTALLDAQPTVSRLSNPALVFDDEFNESNVNNELSSYGPIGGDIKWICHTPYGGDFDGAGSGGCAKFGDSGVDQKPFDTDNGYLRVHAWYSGSCWTSGLLCSVDQYNNGFSVRAPFYVECKFQAPPLGPGDTPGTSGSWPAFWLLTTNRNPDGGNYAGNVAEIDGPEVYSDNYENDYLTWHEWGPQGGFELNSQQLQYNANVNLSQAPHVYGIYVGANIIIWYMDGQQVWSQPTYDGCQCPFYLMVDYALGGYWPIRLNTANNYSMNVYYVRCWQLSE